MFEVLKKSWHNYYYSFLGYMICEKVDTIENDTHTLFIGKLKEADVFKDDNIPLTLIFFCYFWQF